MNRNRFFTSTVATLAVLATIATSITIADPAKDSGSPEKADMQLPPGWTPADMQAVIAAATPGTMHEYLVKSAGVWHGENTMWMAPNAAPIKSESTTTITPILGGRFVKVEMEGTMPGAGKYHGLAIYGYDNVSGQFVSTFVDNMGTGIAKATGTLSDDGKTLTWRYTYNCPVTKKPAVMRDVSKFTGANTKTLVMYGVNPKTGKEYKMMKIEMTREEAGEGE